MNKLTESLEYEFSLAPSQDPAFAHYLSTFSGRALAWDDARGEDRVVAEIHGYKLDLAAARFDHVPLEELLDSVSSDLSDFKDVVVGADGHCPPLSDSYALAGCDSCDCIVYLDKLLVDPGFRGQHIGTQLMARFSEVVHIDHCLLGLKAYPLAEDGTPLRRTPSAIERVKHFYERLGFQRARGEFMVKDASLCAPARKRHRPRPLAVHAE